MSELSFKPLRPAEGLCVLHLFYRINRTMWKNLNPTEQAAGKARLEEIVAEATGAVGWEKFQVVTLSMIAHADLGFMIVGPDLQQLNILEKRISWALGPEVLEPVLTYLSLTEKSEYTKTEEEYAKEMEANEHIKPGTPEMEQKLATFREMIKKYTTDRVYPTLPDWNFVCFYPMNKKRLTGQNWYALDFEKRRDLMQGHARVGRKYAGRVKQLVTGSTGLDDWEWGVTLFANDPFDIKAIVYEMRFDEVSHDYAEFGPFLNGLRLSLPEIYQRLML